MDPVEFTDPRAPDIQLILVPVKPLNVERPDLSWDQKADLALVRKGINWLKAYLWRGKPLALPLIGTGNGGLPKAEVQAIITEILGNDKLVVIADPGSNPADSS